MTTLSKWHDWKAGHEFTPEGIIEVLIWQSSWTHESQRVQWLEMAKMLAAMRAKPVWLTKDNIGQGGNASFPYGSPDVLAKVSVDGTVTEFWNPGMMGGGAV